MNGTVLPVIDGVLFLLKDSVNSLEIWLDPGLLVEKQVPIPVGGGGNAVFPTYIQLGSWPLIHRFPIDHVDPSFNNFSARLCNTLYMGVPLKKIQKLQMLQNVTVHLLFRLANGIMLL